MVRRDGIDAVSQLVFVGLTAHIRHVRPYASEQLLVVGTTVRGLKETLHGLHMFILRAQHFALLVERAGIVIRPLLARNECQNADDKNYVRTLVHLLLNWLFYFNAGDAS